MRDYSVVKPSFWISGTGKKLRGDVEAQIIAFYLMTGPHSTMTGVFHCPIMYMAHETGLDIQGASKGLQSLINEDFCFFDDDSETVFVTNALRYQVGENLKPKDNRVKGIKKQFESLPETRAKAEFLNKYWDVLGLDNPTKKQAENTRGLQGASKAHRSQDQDQEQDQDIKQQRAAKKNRLEIQTTGNNNFLVTDDLVSSLERFYPALDVEQQLRNIAGHFHARPDELRPRTKITQFIHSWMQNRANQVSQGQSENDDPLGLNDKSWINDLVFNEDGTVYEKSN